MKLIAQMKSITEILLLTFVASTGSAQTFFDKIMSTDWEHFRIIGSGFVTDDSHPMHAGDFRKYDITLRIFFNPELGEAALEFDWMEGETVHTDKYFVRRGQVFQMDDKGDKIDAKSFGDLSPATVAAIHPEIVANAILERRENIEPDHADGFLFAWNDELWSIRVDNVTGRIISLHRRVHHDVHGDGSENIHYDGQISGERSIHPAEVSINLGGRRIAHFEFGTLSKNSEFTIPTGERYFDHNRIITESEIEFTELAPNLFTIELPSINTRVFIAEFMDFLVVLEGAYNSRNCDKIAKKISERFKKPVKFFAFSHLHGQYAGGTRSWVAKGATIIVPPTTVKLVEDMVNIPSDLQPDELTRNPKPLVISSAKEGRRIDDPTNALEIYNVESQHTDEYFLFYFPRQKVLLTGDLLFYRPTQTPSIRGRSVKLCETVQKLGLDVEKYVCTWPLIGYETRNIVSKAEFQDACNSAR
jgi:glyoxylase-like metal-dependent hydrolase (beta-lactamase superfamily II)